MSKALRGAALCVFALAVGCATAFDSIIESMAGANCEIDASVKVGKSKKVLLFADHYIYVAGTGSKWNPSGTTKNQFGTSWKNQDLVNYRVAQIKKSMAEVNKIFDKNGVNIQLYDSGYDVVVDSKMIPGQVSYWSGALDHTATVVADTAQKKPGRVHVHWSWTAIGASGLATAEIAVATDFYIVVTDNPKGGDVLSPVKFAHEMVHALGYETHESAASFPTNLMLDHGGGTDLNQSQIQVLWKTVNSSGKKLTSLTCDV